MKTVEELYKEIATSTELQEELKAVSYETLGDFLSKHGFNATAEEFVALVKSKAEGEIEDDDVATIAGGTRFFVTDDLVVAIIPKIVI